MSYKKSIITLDDVISEKTESLGEFLAFSVLALWRTIEVKDEEGDGITLPSSSQGYDCRRRIAACLI